MKDVLKINWKNYADNAETHQNTKWVPDVDSSFLPHLLPVLGSLPLKYNDKGLISATDILTSLSEDLINTPNGSITGLVMSCMLRFLYFMPRSKLLKETQTKNPVLGSLTPLPMYAVKLHHNIPYSKWDKSDVNLKVFLGRYLEPLLVKHKYPPIFDRADVIRNRERSLTFKSGARVGTMAGLTNYKCGINYVDVTIEEDSYDDENPYADSEYQYPLPPVIIRMMLQTWIANASLRKPNVMILDPIQWDNVHKPLDTELSITTSTQHSEIPWPC